MGKGRRQWISRGKNRWGSARNAVRDRDIAARFAPVFHQALGSAPRFDYITNFDFDGDWHLALAAYNWGEGNVQRAIARKGGESVPREKRSFSQNAELAAEAGRKGGRSVSPSNRSFARDKDLAKTAGRKGGRAAHAGVETERR